MTPAKDKSDLTPALATRSPHSTRPSFPWCLHTLCALLLWFLRPPAPWSLPPAPSPSSPALPMYPHQPLSPLPPVTLPALPGACSMPHTVCIPGTCPPSPTPAGCLQHHLLPTPYPPITALTLAQGIVYIPTPVPTQPGSSGCDSGSCAPAPGQRWSCCCHHHCMTKVAG